MKTFILALGAIMLFACVKNSPVHPCDRVGFTNGTDTAECKEDYKSMSGKFCTHYRDCRFDEVCVGTHKDAMYGQCIKVNK